MRWRGIFLMIAFLASVAVVFYCAVPVWRLIEAPGRSRTWDREGSVLETETSIHQISIKNELRAWEYEYRTLRDWREAWLAAAMLEYAQTYYVPGPGYRGSARTEAELETQRARMLGEIARGLREFTGQDFGTNAARWQQWLIQQAHAGGQ